MRVLLVVIALGLSMAIMVSIPSGVVANQEAAQRLSSSFSATISGYQTQINQSLTLITCSLTSQPSGTNFGPPGRFVGGLNQEFMNESIIANITSASGVRDVVPTLLVSEGVNESVTRFGRTFTFMRPSYTISGVPLNSSLINGYPVLSTNITQGRNLHEDDSGVVVLSLNNTQYFGVGVGGTVDILGSTFTVVGVHGSTAFGQTLALYMNITDAQKITDHVGEISSLDVYAENSSVASTIATEIQSMYPELTVTTASSREAQLQDLQQRYTTSEQDAQSNLAQTQSTATQEIIIALVATSLVVLFVMLYTVRERTKEIGTLKAIGFSNWSIVGQFILEGVLISVIAGVVGIALASVGAPILTSLLLPHVSQGLFGGGGFGVAPSTAAQVTSSIPSPEIMLLGIGASAILGAIGSLYPAFRAARIRPAEAMRYE
jgi:putative ABC transport system permease protein